MITYWGDHFIKDIFNDIDYNKLSLTYILCDGKEFLHVGN